jgi:antitoxin (DNA-binding transcriptional repressor) of toxin-antitoxin stability system
LIHRGTHRIHPSCIIIKARCHPLFNLTLKSWSSYLDELAKGEIIILCKRNIPIAEIRPIQPPRKNHRPLGLARGEFEVTSAFFEPLPDDMLAEFNGDDI